MDDFATAAGQISHCATVMHSCPRWWLSNRWNHRKSKHLTVNGKSFYIPRAVNIRMSVESHALPREMSNFNRLWPEKKTKEREKEILLMSGYFRTDWRNLTDFDEFMAIIRHFSQMLWGYVNIIFYLKEISKRPALNLPSRFKPVLPICMLHMRLTLWVAIEIITIGRWANVPTWDFIIC